MAETHIPTGNEVVSLPRLIKETLEIKDVTFLHMGSKGMIEILGDEEKPLMKPFLTINGREVPLNGLNFRRISYWIPEFSLVNESFSFKVTILAPIKERGFLVNFQICNRSAHTLKVRSGLLGRWAKCLHCVNEDKKIDASPNVYRSKWSNMPCFDMHVGTPLFAFAPLAEECQSDVRQSAGAIDYTITKECELAPDEESSYSVFWGFGFEEVAAVTSAKEMLRRGYEYELEKTLFYLNQRILPFKDPRLTEVYNTNLFFCLFYSCGITLDTEQLVMVTSRSPRYYVSAAYWDRDSLLWAFPAILNCDQPLAKAILCSVFTIQQRNFGVHSRYIDGTVLEPGFELDELMAPILALANYIRATGDTELLTRSCIAEGVDSILAKLADCKHEACDLYETFLQPTDDERVYPYLAYDNVLVWKALNDLADLFPKYRSLRQKAFLIKEAIWREFVKEKDGRKFFAWSVDFKGQYDIYDEPAGSLQLLPKLGFCDEADEVYRNTVAMIRSPDYPFSFADKPFPEIGCPHAPHPWILSLANSLLCKRAGQSAAFLRRASMDAGIACESVDENTGACTTGSAFATCAGFLCYAMAECKERLDDVYEE